MSYSCNICDNTIKPKCKNKQFKSLTHKDYDEFVRKKHSIQNNFFDVGKVINDYIISHNKKLEIHLVGANFKIEFDKDLDTHITTDFELNFISRINQQQSC